LELVPLAVDFCAEPFVKFDATLVPFCHPPFDHAAAGRLSFGYSFHQESANTPAPMLIGDIEFLDDQIRLRSIGKGNEIINKKSDQFAAFLCDKTMKIRRRTPESLFAQHLFPDSEVFRIFFKLGQLAHQRQQVRNIGFHCFPDFQRCHRKRSETASHAPRGFAQRSGYSITLPRKILSGDRFHAEDFCARGS
jgi:hypothetical protein